MASNTCTPSQSTHKRTYDVLLSFRGEDTRKTFVGHLHHHLQLKGICTFIDDEGLERGKCVSPSLIQAIQESRFAIIVFSKNYASSTWCLDEVATIMECRENLDLIVVPIFYDVDPAQVRKQTGSFAESFAKHEANFGDDKAKVERWRKALTEASNIAGHDLQADKYNGHENTCIKGVVDDIFMQLRQASPVLEKNFVGLESRLQEISTLLEVSSEDVKFIGIWGMGGIGKTTIARAAFAKYSSQFDGACFLASIQENHTKYGLEALQGTLLSELLKERSVHINDVYEGIETIKERLKGFRLLIILDDVDCLEQLEKLVGDGDWFCKGSKVIITTRDMGLLRSHGVAASYEVKKLGNDEAVKLFSWHAFKKESPMNGFEQLCSSIVSYASGLPLALKVLGSFLCGRRESEWRSTLEKIKDIPDKKVLTKLRISFDGLDDGDKRIFLDIACFFRNKRRDYVEDVLKSCDLHPGIGIPVLIERSLLFESNGNIDMHDLIQEMGWYIARENPRSRVWQLDDLDDVEPELMEGLLVTSRDRHSYNENISHCIEAFKRMKKLKILIVESYGAGSFSKMKSSDSLESFGTSIMDNYLPSSLRWLDFSYYHLFSLPDSFRPSKLVGFHFPHSFLKIFRITKSLDRLTYLDLSSSRFLLETPNFERMPNLERLYLSGCVKLKEIHPSVGRLKKLVSLDLSGCSDLEKLPSFIQVESLKFFNLGFCKKLENFPEIQASMPDLVELDLQSIGIRELPSSIQQLHGLTKLRLVDCENLVYLSDSLCDLKNLKVLELERCFKLEFLPENLGNLSQLEKLHVKETAIFRLPYSIKQLNSIEYLHFGELVFGGIIPKVVVHSVSGLCSLKRLELCDLRMGDEGLPQDLGCLTSLEYLNLRGNYFVHLPESFSQLPCLQYLDIRYCELEKLPELPPTIRELYADSRLAFKSNITELANKYSELYLVSFTDFQYLVEKSSMLKSDTVSARKFIHFSGSFLRKIPFSVTYHPFEYPCHDLDRRWFRYQCRGSNKISINLDPFWYRQAFVGFVVCCLLPSQYDIWKSHPDIGCFENCGIIAKLEDKNNGNGVLQTKCVISKLAGDKEFCHQRMCFAYIPFSSLWPGSMIKMDGVTPNDYSIFEAFLNLEVSTNWGCSLVYKNDKMMIGRIRRRSQKKIRLFHLLFRLFS